MRQIVDALNFSEAMTTIWVSIVWAAAAFLFTLGLAIFFQRERAIKFLEGYASSITVNTLEALLRLLVGVAFIGASTQTKFPLAIFAFGSMLVVTAIPIALLPKLHQRFARWAIPFAIRILPLHGAGSIFFSGIIVYSLF